MSKPLKIITRDDYKTVPRIDQSTVTKDWTGDYINGYLVTREREIPIKIDVNKIMKEHTQMSLKGKKRCRTNAIVIVL